MMKKAENISDKKSEGQEDNNFLLYTEKIVVSPKVKYKSIINFFKLIGAAVVFGVVASFVMALMYTFVFSGMVTSEVDNRTPLILKKDEYPTDYVNNNETGNWYETETAQAETAQSANQTDTLQTNVNNGELSEAAGDKNSVYISVVEKVKKSIVRIDDTQSNVDSALSDTYSITETVGIIIGESDDEYIILTDNSVIEASQEKIIKISEATEVKAHLISADAGTGVAILSMGKENIPYDELKQIQVASLDNSYMINQGDTFIAAGRLYGQTNSVDSGLVTGVSTQIGIDNSYEIIETGINATEGDYAFLFNMSGNVIGISRNFEEDARFLAIGISDLKPMIELLSAGLDITYMGIKGVNVNDAVAARYELPYGIYIKDVILDSPAFNAGLQAGDVIIDFDGGKTLTVQSLNAKLCRCSNGQNVAVIVKRPAKDGYRELTFNVQLSVR